MPEKKKPTPLDNSIAKLLHEPVPGDKEGRTFGDLAAIAVVKAGLSGDRRFLRQLVNASKTKAITSKSTGAYEALDKEEQEIVKAIHSALDSQLS